MFVNGSIANYTLASLLPIQFGASDNNVWVTNCAGLTVGLNMYACYSCRDNASLRPLGDPTLFVSLSRQRPEQLGSMAERNFVQCSHDRPVDVGLAVYPKSQESQLVLPFFVVWSTTTIAISRLLLSMKNVQGPEDWGQQVKIAIPDLELTTIREGGLVGIVSRFSEDDDPLSYQMDRKPVPKMSHIGRYDEHL
ncbi:hypothetical protein AG1IA_04654 [Rhizoctonia solani AG-1 IA]|uniref:Uncharacterized protein n=1 Tax=Thanatephorus cucumeris (strain AG1-IA) TaxID=983506 RepID=L8WYA0_THACA|nr:hypothetical protein AG1IA_04654 [Rhizoctonia solani AG-1 IA]